MEKTREGWGRSQETGLFIAICVLVGLLSLLPLARLIFEAVAPGGEFSLAAAERALAGRSTWVALRNSIEVSIGGTILAVVLGTVVALAVALTDMRARNAFVLCFVLPLMIAPQVTALAWLQVAGPASPLLRMLGIAPPIGTPNPLYSREGIILLLGLQYSPLIFLALRAGLRSLPRELIEAGLAAGATRMQVLRTIVLPLMTPALVAGVALAFVSCVGNFGIPAFLGIPGRYLVLPTLIYQRLSGLGVGVLSEVAVLSMLIGSVAMIGIVVQDLMLRRRDFRVVTTSAAIAPFGLRLWRLPVEIVLWTVTLFVLVVPIVGLFLTSLVPAYGVPVNFDTATLDNYRYVLFDHAATRRAFINSFSLAGGAAILLMVFCVPLGYFLVWKRSAILRALNLVIELPYALPGVVLAIAAILLFLRPLPVLGFSIYNTAWIIFVAYLARFLVLAARPTVSGYHQIDRALEEAAQVSGARLIYRMRTILFPLVAPAATAGALLIFLTAFNELTVSALLWSSGVETLGVVVFSFEQGGFTKYAAAVALLTVIVTFALMMSTLLVARRLPAGVLPWRD